jgi:hypothetical protein
VSSYNWIGESGFTDPVSTTILGPFAPQNLLAKVGNTNQVNLTWVQPYADADGFKLERAPDVRGEPGIWTQIAVVSARNAADVAYTDTNVQAFTTNWYRVKAFNSLAESEYSIAAGVPIIPPVTPHYLSASVFRDQISLGWYDSYFGIIDGFKIERALDASGHPGTWAQIATVSAYISPGNYYAYYTDTNRAANTRYWYRVRAFNWVGNSVYSDSVSATIVPPLPPTSLNAEVGSTNQVHLYWYNSYADADQFEVQRATDVGGTAGTWTNLASINVTNTYYGRYTDTNAIANTTNWYRVRAINVVGTSPYCSPASVRIVAPSVPILSATAITTNRVNLYWYGVVGRTDGYKIERAPDISGAAGPWEEIASVVSPYGSYGYYSDTTVISNSAYWYRLRAYNWIDDSSYSAEVKVAVVPPSAPTNLTITALTGPYSGVYLSWNASSTQDGFKVERAADANGSPGMWFEIGYSYYGSFYDYGVPTSWYRIRAYNGVGYSPYSDPVRLANASSFDSSVTPSILRITGVFASNHDVLLTWTAPAGTTNMVEASSNLGGIYSNISPEIVISGSGLTATNFLDIGALTNVAARFYRIRSSP